MTTPTKETLQKTIKAQEGEIQDLKERLEAYEAHQDNDVSKHVLDKHENELAEKDGKIKELIDALNASDIAKSDIQKDLDKAHEAEAAAKALYADSDDIDDANLLSGNFVDFHVIDGMTGVVDVPNGKNMAMQTLAMDVAGMGAPGIFVVTMLDGSISQQLHKRLKIKTKMVGGKKTHTLESVQG